ncbi:MAG: hypothetical protein JXA30_06310 [Deltaproteobacteria bacterium]|nr:hypothetical protein [Deltaproteobacteria bacterium]
MSRQNLATLAVSCSLVLASCTGEASKKIDAGNQGGAGSGGGQVEGGAGQSGNSASSPCPAGLQCTAPAGEFVCTEPATGKPPLCANQSECAFGACTQYEGQGYCTQACGPAAVDACPAGSICNGLSEGPRVCAQSVAWSSPPCQSQADCPFGECMLSYNGEKLCLLPCRPTLVKQCPGGTACAPFTLSGRFYCVRPATGIPDSCSLENDTCGYGKCLGYEDTAYEGTSYCTQECEPQMVASCPGQTICRAIAPFGFLCSERSTSIPPTCTSQADCAFGTCIKNGDESFCTEYCAKPGTDITGTVYGMSGFLPGVKVCIFENDSVNESLCATTDSEGYFALYGLAESSYFIVAMTKDGYQSNLQLALANTLTVGLMYTNEEIALAARSIGVTYPTGNTGIMVFSALDSTAYPVAGYTAAITPLSGTGPFYANADNSLDNAQTISSTTGWGAFYNLTPGKYKLDFTHPSLACEDLPDVSIVSGYLTYVVSGCF